MNDKDQKQIVVRFPPSPTGQVHIGNVRTLLFNYLYARQNNGKIVFRFEDTDKERSQAAYEQPMLDALRSLGLSWDEGPYRQSERGEIYKKYLHKLVEEGKAYEGEINAQGTGKIIRLKNEARDIIWQDLVKGEIKINTHTFIGEDGNADIVIARSIDDAIYHFTVVVDDWLMGVTHVVRGDDHISSTPRQIMILEALGANIPAYAHLPTIIGEDKKKLSKRNGTTSLQMFLDLGYTKEAMVNYLAFLGWNPGDEREFFTIDELVKEFKLEKCQKSPAQFDFKKLDNINKHYLDEYSESEYLQYIYDYLQSDLDSENSIHDTEFLEDKNKFDKIILTVMRERINKASEILDLINLGEINCFYTNLYNQELANFDKSKLLFKTQSETEMKELLNKVKSRIEESVELKSEENWTVENLKNLIFDWAGEYGRGNVMHPLRVSLSLLDKSPDPFTIMSVLGREESLRRLDLFLK
jgi:glutamyl-tRNA synthetase